MKSKAKNDVIECKKQRNKVVKPNKRCKQEFFDKLGIKINLNHFGQFVYHINMKMVMQIFSLLKLIQFYLITVK